MAFEMGALPIMVIRAQIFKKNDQIFFFHAQAKMLSFKIMLRLKCSDENKCSDKDAQIRINIQIKMLSFKKNAPFEMIRFCFLKNKFDSVMSYDETGKITNNFYLH